MIIKKNTFKGYRGFEPDDVANFNGLPIKLLRTIAVRDGQTWRVETLDGSERFNIEVSMLHLLTKADDGND